MHQCPACGASHGSAPYTVNGFEYVACPLCGARSIVQVPEDLGRYYGDGYYSLREAPSPPLLHRLRARLYQLWPDVFDLDPKAHGALAGVMRLRPPKDARILDVGCGNGALLALLDALGYRALRGIDPFAKANGPVERVGIGDVHGTFDIVMLHHVLEHDAQPVTMLRHAARLLSPLGRVLVRTPVADSWACETFGPERWRQHDPPRHLVIHTRESLRRVAERAGLVVVEMRDDATVRMTSETTRERVGGPFVRRLNREHRGDQVCVVMGHFATQPVLPVPLSLT